MVEQGRSEGGEGSCHRDKEEGVREGKGEAGVARRRGSGRVGGGWEDGRGKGK